MKQSNSPGSVSLSDCICIGIKPGNSSSFIFDRRMSRRQQLGRLMRRMSVKRIQHRTRSEKYVLLKTTDRSSAGCKSGCGGCGEGISSLLLPAKLSSSLNSGSSTAFAWWSALVPVSRGGGSARFFLNPRLTNGTFFVGRDGTIFALTGFTFELGVVNWKRRRFVLRVLPLDMLLGPMSINFIFRWGSFVKFANVFGDNINGSSDDSFEKSESGDAGGLWSLSRFALEVWQASISRIFQVVRSLYLFAKDARLFRSGKLYLCHFPTERWLVRRIQWTR